MQELGKGARYSMAANNNPTTEVFTGLVERVTFHNEDNGYPAASARRHPTLRHQARPC